MAASTDALLQLSDAELAALGEIGVRRTAAASKHLYREGDSSYDFYAILAGAFEIVIMSDGQERVIARHNPAGFLVG